MGKKLLKFLKDRGDFLLFNGLIAFVISLSLTSFRQESLSNCLIWIVIPIVAGNILYFIITGWNRD